jgi:hypothetical protein
VKPYLALAFASVAAAACAAAKPAGPPEFDGEVPYHVAMAEVSARAAGSSASVAPALSASLPPMKSSMLAELVALGLEPTKLPKLDAMDESTKKKLMPLLQRSLGYGSCTGCHAPGDLHKETRQTKIAEEMWDHFVVELRDAKGGAVFCDSCHQGKADVLARGNLDTLNQFMDDHYVSGFTRADGEEHGCSTCHGGEFEMKIIDKLWEIPRPEAWR